jgi:predicted metal-dependent hydrolase
MQAQYQTRCGTCINYTLRRSARKNIIVRSGADGVLNINVPPYISARQWQQWLQNNEAVLLKLQRQSSAQTATRLPESLWYRGESYPCRIVADNDAMPLWQAPQGFRLPESIAADIAAAKQQLRQYLYAQAQAVLLPQLQQHAERLQYRPAAIALSKARTFWGVCRTHTGIRLNWRLIGAPAWVVDYVCIHELCHLSHANHSPAFWGLVNRHTPHTQAAKTWLHRHGQALFLLD